MCCKIFNRIILFFLVCVSIHGYAQNSVSGTVLDSLTHEPVPFANIFFANTLIGTATDLNGTFQIKNIPDGKYDFTISCVGYKTLQKALEFDNTELQNIGIALPQNPIKLNEVRVMADTTGWYGNYQNFKKNFIGEFKGASAVKIQKPHDIFLYFDSRDRVLVAYASNEIAIENYATGFLVYYKLDKFELDYKEGRIVYYGVPRFQNMIPGKESDTKKWEKQRERIFKGSLSHVLLSILHNQLDKNDFVVNELFRIPNPKRPSDGFLTERINYWRGYKKTNSKLKEMRMADDSLDFYYDLRSQPVLVDSIGRQITDTKDIINDNNTLQYKGLLRVVYKGEREEFAYAQSQGRAQLRYQYSVVQLRGDQLKIYDNGYYENQTDVFLEGYLGWYEKIGNLLPLEYSLPEN